MKKTVLNIFAFVFTALLVAVNVSAVAAVSPRLTLNPLSKSVSVGSTFTVVVGVNSDGEKSSAVDVWATFDKTKLEVVTDGIIKALNPPFAFEMTPKSDNVAGTFQFSCVSTSMNAFEDTVINGDLAVVTFRAKAVGTAALNFTCSPGSTVDSNIFNSDINDVISCSANGVGSYTITAGDSTSVVTSTPTLTPTSTSTSSVSNSTPTVTVAPGTLPQTGAIGATVGLIVFGVISLASALFLKFL
ncbi:MAG: cohesin domain-containing protein [Candidatus Shapirobacteria bacterium]|jgi:hypothetical protein